MGLSLNNITDCFVFLYLMVIVGFIYIRNNMVYMNPVINIMGYKVYDCKLDSIHTQDKEMQSIVVAPCGYQMRNGLEITGSGKQGFIYIKK